MHAPSNLPTCVTFQAELINGLKCGGAYRHPVDDVELLQTHISYVLLAGDFAYKVKKAVDFGFLDFRTLSARRYYCLEEVRLNRRTAPDLYIDVVGISGHPERPEVDGAGPPIEYAVRMRRFERDATLDRLLERGLLDFSMIDVVADAMVAFHQSLPAAAPEGDQGSIRAIEELTGANLACLSQHLTPHDKPMLETHALWVEQQHRALRAAFQQRLAQGHVRECHGDLHLANIAWISGRAVFFDCIEFDAGLRWIDVMNELAFLAMDLQSRGRADLSWRLINRYLEATGDYGGLEVLRYYMAYRAMVRAKVATLKAAQDSHESGASAGRESARYIRLASTYAGSPSPAIILTHGLSGSGKSFLSERLCQVAGAIRLRSDVERKRIHGLWAGDHSHGQIGSNLYRADATRSTYQRLRQLSAQAIQCGYSIVVDAAFLVRWQRDLFLDLARRCRIPCVIVDLDVDLDVLRARVSARHAHGRDASDADLDVLEWQITTSEPLNADELAITMRTDGGTLSSASSLEVLWTRIDAEIRRQRHHVSLAQSTHKKTGPSGPV